MLVAIRCIEDLSQMMKPGEIQGKNKEKGLPDQNFLGGLTAPRTPSHRLGESRAAALAAPILNDHTRRF